MSTAEKNNWSEVIDDLLDKYGEEELKMMPILQDIQLNYGHVPLAAQSELAVNLDISPTQVSEVVSFYAFLSQQPKGKFIVRLCQTISCEMEGKKEVAEALEEELGIEFGQTTDDNMFTLEYTNCMGRCDEAPAMLVNDDMHANLTPESVRETLQRYRGKRGVE